MKMERAGQSGCWLGLGLSLIRSFLQGGDGVESGGRVLSAEVWCIPWSHTGLFSQRVPAGEDFPPLKAVRSLEPIRSDFSKKKLSLFCFLSVTAPVAAGFMGRMQMGRDVFSGCTSLWPQEGSIT